MGRARSTFRQRDVAAAIKAAEAAGKEVFGVRISPDGSIMVITAREATTVQETADEKFDRWLATHETRS
jgi:hypothetical protein